MVEIVPFGVARMEGRDANREPSVIMGYEDLAHLRQHPDIRMREFLKHLDPLGKVKDWQKEISDLTSTVYGGVYDTSFNYPVGSGDPVPYTITGKLTITIARIGDLFYFYFEIEPPSEIDVIDRHQSWMSGWARKAVDAGGSALHIRGLEQEDALPYRADGVREDKLTPLEEAMWRRTLAHFEARIQTRIKRLIGEKRAQGISGGRIELDSDREPYLLGSGIHSSSRNRVYFGMPKIEFSHLVGEAVPNIDPSGEPNLTRLSMQRPGRWGRFRRDAQVFACGVDLEDRGQKLYAWTS